jgi:hypothetical protein
VRERCVFALRTLNASSPKAGHPTRRDAARDASPLTVSVGRRADVDTTIYSQQVSQALPLPQQQHIAHTRAEVDPRLRQRWRHPQSIWIVEPDGVVQRVAVRVDAAEQSNGIRLRVSPDGWVVVAEVVVVQRS